MGHRENAAITRMQRLEGQRGQRRGVPSAGPRALALLSLIGALTVGQAALAAEAPPHLAHGEIEVSTHAHPDTTVRWGRAVAVVDAPVEQVMDVVSNYGAYREFMPHFRTSKVLAQRGDSALVYMEALIAKGTLTVWAQLKIRPQADDSKRIVVASMTKGNLDHMEARWEVSPLSGDRSLVAFEILVDPKVPFPSSLVSTENEKASRRTLRALRERLTKHVASSSR